MQLIKNTIVTFPADNNSVDFNQFSLTGMDVITQMLLLSSFWFILVLSFWRIDKYKLNFFLNPINKKGWWHNARNWFLTFLKLLKLVLQESQPSSDFFGVVVDVGETDVGIVEDAAFSWLTVGLTEITRAEFVRPSPERRDCGVNGDFPWRRDLLICGVSLPPEPWVEDLLLATFGDTLGVSLSCIIKLLLANISKLRWHR